MPFHICMDEVRQLLGLIPVVLPFLVLFFHKTIRRLL